MGSTNQLKNRFEKLQKESLALKEAPVPVGKTVEPASPSIELKTSAKPEIHAMLRESSKSSFDWKNQFKKTFVRPSLENSRPVSMTEVEWNIQAISDNSVLLSFTQSEQLEESLVQLAAHLKKRKVFWSKVLRNAEHLHVYVDKNKTHLGIRYCTPINAVKNDLKYALEEEYLSGSNTIKTFYMKGQNDWIEIILEISAVKNERKTGEASV